MGGGGIIDLKLSGGMGVTVYTIGLPPKDRLVGWFPPETHNETKLVEPILV